MASPYYQQGEERATRVRALFASIARRYDLINDLQSFWLHRTWKRRLIALSGQVAGKDALDLCCGTGDVAFRLATREARVTALDFSGEMLGVAVARPENARLKDAPRFLQGDAMATPFEDAAFDLVTMSYGLRNLADFRAGLSEMLRVCRPGGRLLILDFGLPANPLWRGLYLAYLRLFVPILGKLFAGDSQAYAYILDSLKNYPAQEGVSRMLAELGAPGARVVNLLGGVMSIHVAEKE